MLAVWEPRSQHLSPMFMSFKLFVEYSSFYATWNLFNHWSHVNNLRWAGIVPVDTIITSSMICIRNGRSHLIRRWLFARHWPCAVCGGPWMSRSRCLEISPGYCSVRTPDPESWSKGIYHPLNGNVFALMFSLLLVWTGGWTKNRDVDDLRRSYYSDMTLILL